MNWFNEKEKLKDLLIVNNKSYEEVGRMYKVTGAAIKKQCKKIGIELKMRRKINPKETFNKGKNKTYKRVLLDNENNFISNSTRQKDTFSYRNYKNLGEVGERVSIGELAKFGIDVLLPMSDNLPFDFVVFYNNKFYKCQVKTTNAITENNSLDFSLTSNNWNKGTIHKYTKEEVDVIICCDLENIYLFKIDEIIGKTHVCLRKTFPKNKQLKNIKFTSEYIISSDRINKVFN